MIKNKMESICGDKKYFMNKNKKLGQGEEGAIYEACSFENSRLDCDRAVKIFPLYYNSSFDEIAAELKIGPSIYIRKCPEEERTYFILEKLAGTLQSYLRSNVLTENDKKQLQSLLFKAINDGKFFHNDLHSENIMYKKHGSKKTFYLIDFSMSTFIGDVGRRNFKRKIMQNSKIEDLDARKDIQLFTDEQIQYLYNTYCPQEQYSKKEEERKKKREQAIRAARKEMAQKFENTKYHGR
jgi:hypothetical protein